MKDLKGTKTERNLQEAFAGESMARNKYTFYASKARNCGFTGHAFTGIATDVYVGGEPKMVDGQLL